MHTKSFQTLGKVFKRKKILLVLNIFFIKLQLKFFFQINTQESRDYKINIQLCHEDEGMTEIEEVKSCGMDMKLRVFNVVEKKFNGVIQPNFFLSRKLFFTFGFKNWSKIIRSLSGYLMIGIFLSSRHKHNFNIIMSVTETARMPERLIAPPEGSFRINKYYTFITLKSTNQR